jgi:hypothetical protein
MAKGNRATTSTRDAKEQAAEYFGFAGSTFVEGKSGRVYEIPSPALLDDDQQERWDELQFTLEQCDREDDIVIPERVRDDGTVSPERVIEGDVKKPYRINGELLKPTYNARLAIALFGNEGYEEFKADGGSGSLVALEWARMNKEYMERVEADSKSDSSPASLEVVSSRD